jgi:hypothetical protein
VGARINGLSSDIAAGLTLQIPTLAAVKNYVTDYVASNTSGVASLNSLTGTLNILGGSNIGISAASGSITVTNNGVRTLGVSGDWKKAVVTIFGGSTGALLVSGATWGSATVTNAGNVGGIANGTNLAGKTVFEIIESLLFSYQTVSFASAAITAGTFTTGNLELGQTAAASGNYTFSWTVNNSSNVDSTGMTVIYTGGGGIGSGSVIGATAYSPTTGRVGNLGINARGLTIGSSFSMTAQASQATAYAAAGSPGTTSGATASSSLGTATWYSKIYYGYTTGTSITGQSQLVTTGMGSSERLITSTSTSLSFANGSGTTLAFTPASGGGSGLKYLYVLVHDYYGAISNWYDASNNLQFGMTGNGGAAIGATLSITNAQGFAATYKVYRSAEATDTSYVSIYSA